MVAPLLYLSSTYLLLIWVKTKRINTYNKSKFTCSKIMVIWSHNNYYSIIKTTIFFWILISNLYGKILLVAKQIFNSCVIKCKIDFVPRYMYNVYNNDDDWTFILYLYRDICVNFPATAMIIPSTFRFVRRFVCKGRQVKTLLTQISVHVGIYHFLFIAYKFYGNTMDMGRETKR